MSLLGELLGPCRVGSYLFGCFIFIFFFPLSFPSPPLPLPPGCRGGGKHGGIGRVAIPQPLRRKLGERESAFTLMDAWGGPAPRWSRRRGARLLLLLLTVRLGSG